MRTYVRAMGQPDDRRRRGRAPSRLPRPRRGAPLRRARGAGHSLLRSAGEVGAQPGSGAFAHAVPLDDQSLPGLFARVRLLPGGRNADRAGQWLDAPARGARRRRPHHGHRVGGRRTSPRRHRGRRALGDRQAGVPRHARRRPRARRQRRPPIPDRPRLGVRRRSRAAARPVARGRLAPDGRARRAGGDGARPRPRARTARRRGRAPGHPPPGAGRPRRAPACALAGGGVATPVIAARATCDAPRARVVARVASVEPLRAPMQLYDITTGTGDFVANGVISHNCFARPTHTYLDMNAGRDFEREIVVKVNAPEVLRTELARPSWTGEPIAMGTNTDPYQWVEGRYRLMRGIWEALRDFANPCSVLTKSPLLLRDLDLMLEIAKVTDIAANLSIPTMDEKPWRASEPHTPSPRARMEAVKELNRAGIPTGILVAPLMPGINDAPHQVERILAAAGEAGATGISGIALHLRGEVRGIFMDWLRSYRPDLVERYEALYRRGAYAPREEQDRLRRLLRTTSTETGHDPPRRSPADSRGVRGRGAMRPPDPRPPARPPDARPPGPMGGEPARPGPVRAGRQEALF